MARRNNSTELPNDPNRGIPIRELLKKHGKLKVAEKTEWFDERAKPPEKKIAPSEFEPDPNVKDADL